MLRGGRKEDIRISIKVSFDDLTMIIHNCVKLAAKESSHLKEIHGERERERGSVFGYGTFRVLRWYGMRVFGFIIRPKQKHVSTIWSTARSPDCGDPDDRVVGHQHLQTLN